MLMLYYYINFPNVQEIFRHHADADRGRRVSPNRLEISGGNKRYNSCLQNEYQFKILSGHYK